MWVISYICFIISSKYDTYRQRLSMDDAVDPPKRRMGNRGPIMCDAHFNRRQNTKIVDVSMQY